MKHFISDCWLWLSGLAIGATWYIHDVSAVFYIGVAVYCAGIFYMMRKSVNRR